MCVICSCKWVFGDTSREKCPATCGCTFDAPPRRRIDHVPAKDEEFVQRIAPRRSSRVHWLPNVNFRFVSGWNETQPRWIRFTFTLLPWRLMQISRWNATWEVSKYRKWLRFRKANSLYGSPSNLLILRQSMRNFSTTKLRRSFYNFSNVQLWS